eukprot:m.65278 g.65278  ORF g.65278 m.65278 type:complete len:581 (-) comp16480_c0_seq1:25-1767(-)
MPKDDDRSKRKRATKKKKKRASEDDDDSDDSGDDYAPSNGRGKATKADDDSDSESVFEYKYGEDLMGDDDDREMISKLNEREREQEFSRRYDERSKAFSRWKTEQELKKQKKRQQQVKDTPTHAEADAAESDAGDTEPSTRRKNQDRARQRQDRRQKSKAIDALKKKKTPSKKSFGDDDDEDSDRDGDDDFQPSSDEEPPPRTSAQADLDDREDEDDDDEENMRPADFAQFQSIRLSRHKLEHWCHEQHFQDTITGCFVRIGIGQNIENRPVYRVAQIVGLKEGRNYQLGKTKTNLQLVLQHGISKRPFRMEFVSNTDFTEPEFQRWVDEMHDNELKIPPVSHVNKKRKDIESAKDRNKTADEIRYAIARKEQCNVLQVFNPAAKVERLERQAQIARDKGDLEAAQTLEDEARQLREEAHAHKEKKKTEAMRGITLINERNRVRNIQLIDTNAHRMDQADVFVRRKTMPSLAATPTEEEKAKDEEGNTDAAAPATTTASASASAAAATLDSDLPSAAALFGTTEEKKPDIFDVHKFDIDVDIDLSALAQPVPKVTPKEKKDKPKGRIFNLSEYKKAKGLI